MNNYLLAGLLWGFFIGVASTGFLIWITDVKFKKHIKQMREGQPEE
jgi:hypothetical protein